MRATALQYVGALVLSFSLAWMWPWVGGAVLGVLLMAFGLAAEA
jgi:hypothetical protein